MKDAMMNTSELINKLKQEALAITTAESCTGGMIMAELTSVSGASEVIDQGFVTYANEAKETLLGVHGDTLATYGAVSGETAFEMVTGALSAAKRASAAIAVTGVAGPSGGSKDKPVGTVWIATAITGHAPLVKHYLFDGDRKQIRQQVVDHAIDQMLNQFSSISG